ncbi:MAG: hypothetical protein ACD_79C00912G0004 [uncultured bacterium]|nr:MAG: hypothetical protein ACD_79C00912G0004 [uncultured bacterium]
MNNVSFQKLCSLMNLRNASLFFFLLSVIGFMSQGLSNYFFGNLFAPLQVIFVFISLMFFLFSNRYLKTGYIPVILSTIVLFHIVFINLDRLDNVLIRFFQIVTGMIIYFLALHISLNNLWLKRLFKVLFLMVCINAIFGIKEIADLSPFPWSCFYGANINGEAVALDWLPVSLGYSLASPVTIAVIFSIYRNSISSYPGKYLSLITAILGMVLIIFSHSRSTLFAVIAGVLVAIILNIKKTNALITGLIVSFLCMIILSIPLIQSYRKIDFVKDPRLIDNFKTYLPIIMANPFAANSEGESAILLKAQKLYGISIDEQTKMNALSLSSAHNSILTTGISLGLIPMLILISLYVYLVIISLKTIFRKEEDSEVRFMSCLMLSAFTSYIVHSHFHNAGLFLGEMRNWIYIGILVRFALDKKIKSQ